MAEKIIYQNNLLYPKVLWHRPVHYYKNKAGKVLVLAGSSKMSGAAILVTEAVFRSGTGLLLLGFPESLGKIYKDILPEAMTLRLPETPSYSLSARALPEIIDNAKSCDVAIIGPGLSTNDETIRLIWSLINELELPIILDGDGLSALSSGIEVLIKSGKSLDIFKEIGRKLILTPHSGEAYRIIKALSYKNDQKQKLTPQLIDREKSRYAKYISEQLFCSIVLKGHDTVIYEQNKTIINKIGGPELASAGSGDVLAGIIGSFVGQNLNMRLEAISTAVYLHGLAGQIAKGKVGERSLIASDIIRYLPEAIKQAEDEIK